MIGYYFAIIIDMIHKSRYNMTISNNAILFSGRIIYGNNQTVIGFKEPL